MLRVLTANLGNRRAPPERVIDGLRRYRAEVVALQELRVDQAQRIESDLAGLYPHRLLEPGGTKGMGLLSRHPMSAARPRDLGSPHPALEATVTLGSFDLRVLTVHPRAWLALWGRWSREMRLVRGAAAWGEDVPAELEPAVLMGDWNTLPGSTAHAAVLARGWLDAWEGPVASGRGATWPVFGRWRGLPLTPFARIDYVFHRPSLQPKAVFTGEDLGSDHLPLVVDFEVEGR